MRLQKLYINGYKKLRNVHIDFTGSDDRLSTYFFVGRNGSGKSSILEALGLIITRIIHGELPGFNFLLQYKCLYENAIVTVRPNPDRVSGDRSTKLIVKVCIGNNEQSFHYLPDQYKPGRIVSYDSGTNGCMEDVLSFSAERALISDMYDEVRRENFGNNLDEIMAHYQRIQMNPNTIALTDGESQFITPLLFAFLPLGKNDGGADTVDKYAAMRDRLFKEVARTIEPIALTLVFDEQRFTQDTEVEANFFSSSLSRLKDDIKSEGWMVNRETKDDKGEIQLEDVMVIPYGYYPPVDAQRPYIKCLCNIFNSDPLYCLSVMLKAYQVGVLKTINFIYKLDGCDELFETRSMSDGELLWLTRMGLLLMAHCKDNVDTLFLLDEPDAHFNDDWQIKFVSTLDDISRIRPQAARRYEYVVSTHSSLILTDVKYDQLFLFEDTGEQSVHVGKAAISSFGALREEISRKIFSTTSIGAYAGKKLDHIIESAQTHQELAPYLDEVGPGYQRLRLYDRYCELMQK
jgi:predicted ATPase